LIKTTEVSEDGLKKYKLKTGPYKGTCIYVDVPDYEIAAAGASCGIFDPEYLYEFNWYCYEYGMDPISTGITIGFLMDCYERGFLIGKDIKTEFSFGNIGGAIKMVHKIASNRGFGKHAGFGIRYLHEYIAKLNADRTGEDYHELYDEIGKFAMEGKGLEFSVFLPKESLLQQGGFGSALTGANIDTSWFVLMNQSNYEPHSFQAWAQALKWSPLFQTWFYSMGIEALPLSEFKPSDDQKTQDLILNEPIIQNYIDIVNGTLGTSKTLDDLLLESERLYNFQKLFNLRQGYGTRVHDYIPERAMGPATTEEYEYRQGDYDKELAERLDVTVEELPILVEERRGKLMELRYEDFNKLMDTVYKEKGWDSNGVPTDETLEKLGLMDEVTRQILENAR
jgi:aldehyde:ferredoxin oxidoreductase